MLSYLFKRLIAMIPTLLGITFVTFLIVNLAPGDPVSTSLGEGGGGGATESSGGNVDRERVADAIKAKKKLLGMVREDHAALVLGLAADGPVSIDARLGEFDGWLKSGLATSDTLIVGGAGGLLAALDPATGEVKRSFTGHTDTVSAVALSADGALLLSGDTDGGLILWDAATGKERARAAVMDRQVRDVVILPDGSQAITGSDDGTIRRFHLPDLNEVGQLVGHNSNVYALALSKDGHHLYSGGYDRVLREWDLDTGEAVRTWAFHPQSINDLALSPDGARLASAGDDRKARVLELNRPDAEPVLLEGNYKRVGAVAWLDDARVATGCDDETVRTWDATTGKELSRTTDSVGKVSALVTSPSGGLIALADSWIKVPIPIRYARWLGRILTLDFDRSFLDERPVIEKIGEALPVTIFLNLISVTIIYLISIPIGVWSAVKRGSTFDHISSVILFVLYSIPSFWLATLLIMGLSSERAWNLLPSVGLISDRADDLSFLQWVWDGALHLVLPVTVMVYGGVASLSRYVRTSLLETIQEDYVRTARAKGLDAWGVIMKHAFRNSLVTIVTLVANLLPAMIGGAVIVEFIFSIQGMGKLGFDAILARDYPVIMAITTFSALLTLLGILVSDLLYSVVDPRVRVE